MSENNGQPEQVESSISGDHANRKRPAPEQAADDWNQPATVRQRIETTSHPSAWQLAQGISQPYQD
eukprot:5365371-Amphidinium_carterae.3